MKTISAQAMFFLRQRGARRNIRALMRFFLILAALVAIYSITFHYVMLWEGQEHTWITGVYWTLTVMSTLGFGDITFQTDLGRLFSILVLATGVVFLLILLPFTIIQFFYAPWVEAQTAAATPRALPEDTAGHVILTRYDPVTAALISKLRQFNYEYVVLTSDVEEALTLNDLNVRVVVGELDDPATYHAVQAEHAALLATTSDDITNTNVAFTARQLSADLPILATATTTTSLDVLDRAGATNIIQLGDMMGKALARCMVGGDAVTHVVGRIDELFIAEANAHRTPLVGKSIRENQLSDLGVNVIGLWERGTFHYARPDTIITDHTILFLAGSRQQLAEYDENFIIYNVSTKPLVILGCGRVGRAAAEALSVRGVDYRMVDLLAERIPDPERGVIGDARDPDVLKRAGLHDAPAVLITTHDDQLNTYLTIYCRSIHPDIQIIARSTLERNTQALHRAGADFVLSYATMGANTIFNLIKRGRIITIAEGLNVLRIATPESLDGRTILTSGVRETTACTIIAARNEDTTLLINPPPDYTLTKGRELILVGSVESENKFIQTYVEPPK